MGRLGVRLDVRGAGLGRLGARLDVRGAGLDRLGARLDVRGAGLGRLGVRLDVRCAGLGRLDEGTRRERRWPNVECDKFDVGTTPSTPTSTTSIKHPIKYTHARYE